MLYVRVFFLSHNTILSKIVSYDRTFSKRLERLTCCDFPGVDSDLPICGRVEAQCCSAEFLQSVRGKVRQRLERFLREEFEDVIDNYQDEIENLLECKLQVVYNQNVV